MRIFLTASSRALFWQISLAGCLTVATAPAQITVGQGSPNETIRSAITRGYYRGNFPFITSLPPLSEVRGLTGASGVYVQEFPDVTKNSGPRFALIAGANVTVGGEVQDCFQLLHPMYDFYTSGTVGVANAGLPLGDTEVYNVFDPLTPSTQINKFQYQVFTRNWALFAWDAPPQTASVATNIVLKDPLYSRWRLLGGLGALGAAVNAEAALTSGRSTTADVQKFQFGYLFNMTSGPSASRIVVVKAPIMDLYELNGGPTGRLGFPINDELNVTIGNAAGKRQQFEGGSVEYIPGQPPVLRNSISSVILTVTGSIRLNLGETSTVRASLTTGQGENVTDRDVSWTTSNNRVVTVQVTPGSTNQVTLRAVGGGSATVTATSEGRTSLPLTVFVSAPCCQVGEGAPTSALTQTFLDAVARNRLAVRLPTPNAVRRAGNGYIQEVTLTDGRRVLLTKSDLSGQAFVVTTLADTYESIGGPTGPLGFPAGDPSTTGRQLFENQNALAGDPPRLVTGAILARWAQLGYDNAGGLLGAPISATGTFITFTTVAGRGQLFRNGAIYAADTGVLAGRAYYVRGVMAAKLAQLGGPEGIAGLPTSDEFQVTGRFRQEFEGVTLEYGPGENEAQVTEKARRPVATATPQTVVAGNHLRLAVGGFAPNSTIRVSLAGQPDFDVETASGAYSWDVFVPATARTGSVTVSATRLGSTPAITAETAYNVRAQAETVFDLRKLSGDTQTGAPGALLPVPIRVRLRDEFGTAIVNYPVRFAASPGAAIVIPGGGNTVTTDANGEAEAQVRMPSSEGVALATAEAGRPVTFSFRVAAATLTNFPRQTQSAGSYAAQPLGPGPATLGQKGSLVAALSSVIRYYQTRGDLPTPNGPAEPGLLNQFLKDYCAIDATNRKVCDGFITGYSGSVDGIVNPWRASAFTGGASDMVIESPTLPNLRDRLAAGQPLILALSLSTGAAPAGAHFVAAIGLTSSGEIEIHDPNPGFNRRTLEAYLNGESGLTGRLTGALRLVPRAPTTGAFLVSANAPAQVYSSAGLCSPSFEFPEVLAEAPAVKATLDAAIFLTACDGTRDPLELHFAAGRSVRARFTSLGDPAQELNLTAPADGAIYRATRASGAWLVTAQTTTFAASSVLSAASFTPRLAPGGLFSIFGSGLSREGTPTAVEVNGTPATVVFQSPFQINARLPLDSTPGTATLRVRSAFGQAEQSINIQPVAPSIFLLGPKQGAIVNQNGTLNSSIAPATRGQAIVVYGTGFGATRLTGQLQTTVQPVTATIASRPAQVLFAGLTPGFIGLYQINVLIPAAQPPGSALPLELLQAGESTGAFDVAVQ